MPPARRRRPDISKRSAEAIVPLVVELIRPQRVVDLGCGRGTWLAAFHAHGVQEVLGVDGEWTDRRRLQIPAEAFLPFDLRRPLHVDRTFDLAVSLEVAEHLPLSAAETLVDSLVALAPVILFSAAIPFQGGKDHLNEQWPEFWINRFARREYVAIDCIRRRIWENPAVAWWYAQNTLVFVRRDALDRYPQLMSEISDETRRPPAVVHPRKYLEIADPSRASARRVLAMLPALAKSVFARQVRRRTPTVGG